MRLPESFHTKDIYMKNEILDDIFSDDLRNQLEPNEKVVWDGRPTITSFTKWSNILGAIILTLFIYNIYIKGWDFSAIVYPIIISFITLWRLFQSRKVRYLITDQRIIFQLWEKRKKRIRTLPFEQIKDFNIRKDNKSSGAILIKTKNPTQYSFNSKNLKTGEDRYLPSLEMIEDVEEVAKYITSGIQNKLLP